MLPFVIGGITALEQRNPILCLKVESLRVIRIKNEKKKDSEQETVCLIQSIWPRLIAKKVTEKRPEPELLLRMFTCRFIHAFLGRIHIIT